MAYTDLNPYFGLNNKDILLYGEEAINGHLSNALGINVGECWWEPTFGCNLRRFLHEPLNHITANSILNEMLFRLPAWLPYIELLSGTGVNIDSVNGSFEVIIKYRVKDSNISGSFNADLKVT